MKHIKQNRCGFKGYTCIGLKDIADIQLVSDSQLYITGSTASNIYLSDPDLWPSNYCNIDNIPRFLKGPVRQIEQVYHIAGGTQSLVVACYTDLSMFGDNVVDMFTTYQSTFQSTQFSQNYDAWASKLISYKSSQYDRYDTQSISQSLCTDIPGILTPLYQAGDFKPISAIAVPVTVNNYSTPVVVKPALGLAMSTAQNMNKSGCPPNTCPVTANFTSGTYGTGSIVNAQWIKVPKSYEGTAYTFRVYMPACEFLVGGGTVSTEAASDSFTTNSSVVSSSGYNVQVYAHVVKGGTGSVPWEAQIRFNGGTESTPKVSGPGQYNYHIATVTAYQSLRAIQDQQFTWVTLKVDQAQCGPLELRDTLEQIDFPGGPGDHYVLHRVGNVTNWMPLIQCST